MFMKKEGVVRGIEKELEDNGYSTAVARNMQTCIDVFATKLGKTIAIKAVHNIDSATRSEAGSLFKIASFLGAEPVIIGESSRNGRLERSVIYKRFSVNCIASDSLEMLEEHRIHYLASRSVGVKARIDGARLRQLRKMSGMSASRLARWAGVSKETVYRYEHGGGYASGRLAEKIGRLLGGDIAVNAGEEEAPRAGGGRKFERTGMMAVEIRNAPFDMVARSANRYEISYDANPRTVSKRAEFFGSLRSLLDSNYPFFISRKREGSVNGIPMLKHDTVRRLRSEKELLEALASFS